MWHIEKKGVKELLLHSALGAIIGAVLGIPTQQFFGATEKSIQEIARLTQETKSKKASIEPRLLMLEKSIADINERIKPISILERSVADLESKTRIVPIRERLLALKRVTASDGRL